jgi:UDP-N-acetylglucosamine transferase subunit ALG13
MKALNAGKKVIAVTRLEKYGEHINDHQIQNNEAFALNKYVLMAGLN